MPLDMVECCKQLNAAKMLPRFLGHQPASWLPDWLVLVHNRISRSVARRSRNSLA
jgi:hypothetical protein